MKCIYLSCISFTQLVLVLLTSLLFCACAQSNFTQLEWAPGTSSTGKCEPIIPLDLSDLLATVTQLITSNDTDSSLPESCMEIKESSPVNPSGYYTISNGSGGNLVVCCNMDELYSCPSLEQTLNEFSNALTGVSDIVTRISGTPVVNDARR